MALEHLKGTTYGPRRVTISSAKVSEYVAATGDDPDRWVGAAPPSYAGALLFAIAPEFLTSEAVAGHTAVLIHADQVFEWHAPIGVGDVVAIAGRVGRVRERAGVDFVSFEATVQTEAGATVLGADATFLLGAEPAGSPPEPHVEPAVAARAEPGPMPDFVDGAWSPVVRSASRLDLVRYASASGDFNPIHFDHDAAVGAGLAGVVVHGLLMAAWLLQPPATLRPGDQPLARAKLRFRNPLYPAEPSILSGSVRESRTDADLALRDNTDTVLVGAQVKLGDG